MTKLCLHLRLTVEGDTEGDFVGLDDGEVPVGGVGEMLGDLLGLSDGEDEGDYKKQLNDQTSSFANTENV